MSNVRLSIGGREFVLSAQPGEEDHIAELGQMIDTKLRAAGGVSGAGESRMLLFAALLLADEIHELRSGGDAKAAQRGLEAEAQLAQLRGQIPNRLAALAERIENLATTLEKAGQAA